jgi:hypothetical protein
MYSPGEYPMTLWQYRGMFPGRLPNARDLTTSTGLVSATVSLPAVHASGTDLLLTAKRITSDIEMAFGVLGPPQINATGALRSKYFYRDKADGLGKWATAWGVEMTEDEGTD